MRLKDIIQQFYIQQADFDIENVSTEDRRAIVEELIASPLWKLDDWVKSSGNMWRQFSVINNSPFSPTISINDGDDDIYDCICCYHS
jgi:hypothetical protein